MSTVIAQNTSTNPILLGDLSRLVPGESKEVPENAVGKGAIKAEMIKILDEMPVVDEAPEAPEAPAPDAGGGSDGLPPLTADEVAAKLFAEPELIPEDGFTGSGAPAVDALEDALGQDFSANERDIIWDKVKELQVGSLDS